VAGARPLDSLQAEDFEPHVGEQFSIGVGPELAFQARLVELTEHGPAAGGQRSSQFSLVFRGPREPVLDQRIYHVEHAELGVLEIFLVPVGPDEVGMRYEAVFA
jgi:hypothetical protein